MSCQWNFRHKWERWEDIPLMKTWRDNTWIARATGEFSKTESVEGQQRRCLRCNIVELRAKGQEIK